MECRTLSVLGIAITLSLLLSLRPFVKLTRDRVMKSTSIASITNPEAPETHACERNQEQMERLTICSIADSLYCLNHI